MQQEPALSITKRATNEDSTDGTTTKDLTNYQSFLEALQVSLGMSELKNEFFDQYWGDTIKAFFQQAEASNHSANKIAADLRTLFGVSTFGEETLDTDAV